MSSGKSAFFIATRLCVNLTHARPISQQTNESGPPEHLVKLFWELEGQNILTSEDSATRHIIDRPWLDTVFARSGEVIAETVKAAAECGSFGLQLMPNAFEVCSCKAYRKCLADPLIR